MSQKQTCEELEQRVKELEIESASLKQAEEALRESEERYRGITEAVTDYIFTVRIESGQPVETIHSAACGAVTGYTPENFASDPYLWFRMVHDQDREAVQEQARQVLSGQDVQPLEHRIFRKAGAMRWVRNTLVPHYDLQGKLLSYDGLISDITELKQAEEALREERDFAESLINTAQTIVLVLDKEGRIVRFNPYFEELSGYKIEEVQGKDWFSTFLPGKDHDHIRKIFKQAVGNIQTKGNVNPILTKDGRKVYIEWCDRTLKDAHGNFVGLLAIGQDITERLRSEKALQNSEKQFKTLFNNSTDAVFIHDFKGQILEVNEVAYKRLGYSHNELLKMTPRDFNPPEQALHVSKRLNKIKGKGHHRFETVHIGRSGKNIPVEIISRTIHYAGKQAIISTARDISERKQAEEDRARLESQLRQAQKMEAIGTLAGGIAHDFNNILTPIMIQTELAKLTIAGDHSVQANLDEVIKAGHRAKDLVKQILTFSRQTDQERVFMDLVPIVEESLKLLRSSLPKTLEIRQSIKGAPCTVLADPTRMQQVVMNLCTNAGQAMQEMGSVLEVALENVELDEDAVKDSHDIAPGSYVMIRVSDTGSGIEPDVIDKIFDPFFTTKATGEGTGMGLSVVHGIVRSHGGVVTVNSQPGKGTTFKVFLPKIEDRAVTKTEEAEQSLPTGNEQILFVDDEQTLVTAGEQMLERLGYQVESRTSSIEALAAFQDHPDKYDLVMTDMTMPNMTGESLAKEVLRVRPDIPIIICTGFSYQMDEQKALSMGIRAFVMKPFVMKDVAETIRKVLDVTDKNSRKSR